MLRHWCRRQVGVAPRHLGSVESRTANQQNPATPRFTSVGYRSNTQNIKAREHRFAGFAGSLYGEPGRTPYRLPSDVGTEELGVEPEVWPELFLTLGSEVVPIPVLAPAAPGPMSVLPEPLDPLVAPPLPIPDGAPMSPDGEDLIWLHPAVIDASARMAIRVRGAEEK